MGVMDKGRHVKRENDRYGFLAFKPSCLQLFNTIRWHVFWNCMFSFFQGFVVNGIINVIIPALETRYGLSSSKSAIIASSNDFGAVVLYTLVGYFGEQRHKPKIMASGIFLMSLGCFVFAIPQFADEGYNYSMSNTNNTDNLCNVNSSATHSCDTDTYNNGYYACFLLGQILLGIGAVPMLTLGLTYIDENCNPKVTSFYIAQSFGASAIGVAIGYIVGGQTLSYFVDVNKVNPESVLLTPSDPQWVGAWWIGIIIGFIAYLLVGFPILGYPRHLPGYDELQKTRKSEAHADGTEQITANDNFGKSWKDFPKAFFLLIRNPSFVLLCLAGTAEALLIGGLATFGSKLLQEFFHIDLTKAGYVMGIITIPGSGGGMLLGGYMVKKLNLRYPGIVKFCASCMFISMFFAPTFLASCPGQPIAGVTQPYQQDRPTDLMSGCNEDCSCSTFGYEPVCDVNKTVYFSPCHAGCNNALVVDGQKTYHNCSCIVDLGAAESGTCTDDCAWFYVFCTLLLLMMLFTFMTMSPGVTACIRCVPHKQRSIAIGLELVIVRLLGTTPGPVLLGAILDSACEVWQVDGCGVTGNCWIYSKSDLTLRLMVWWAGLKLVGVCFYGLALITYKPPEEPELTVNVIENQSKRQEQLNTKENGQDKSSHSTKL